MAGWPCLAEQRLQEAVAMVVQKQGNRWYVRSHKKVGGKRKNLGKRSGYGSKVAAEKRLKQIRFFKYKGSR